MVCNCQVFLFIYFLLNVFTCLRNVDKNGVLSHLIPNQARSKHDLLWVKIVENVH